MVYTTWCSTPSLLELVGSRGVTRVSTGLPPSSSLIEGEVRGQSLLVVSAGAASTAAVKAGKKQLARGVQKPSAGLWENSSQAYSWLLLV
jgi:hypothetical protein